MKNIVQTRCDLVVENKTVVEKCFLLENNYLKIISGILYAERNLSIDVDKIKACRKLLGKNLGLFSNFRSYNELVMSTKMALADDAEKYMKDVLDVYEKLHSGHLCGSTYRAMAAMSIVDMGMQAAAESIAEKTEALMKGMKAQHRCLTSEEDFSYAVLLALTEKSVENILVELDTIFQLLKTKFKFHDNAVYSLAQILVTQEGSAEEKSEKVIRLYDSLNEAGVKYGKGNELATLALLTNLDVEQTTLAQEVVEIADYLKKFSGFKTLQCSQNIRLMFAADIYAGAVSSDYQNGAVISKTITTIIAEQVAMMIMICSISAASIAAASSN